MTTDVATGAMLAMLAARTAGATLCPSEVARAIAAELDLRDGAGWRAAMPTVHAAVDRLLDQGRIQLSWKGSKMAARSGPYRIALTEADIEHR